MEYTIYISRNGYNGLYFPVHKFNALRRKYARKHFEWHGEKVACEVPEDCTWYMMLKNERGDIVCIADVEEFNFCGIIVRDKQQVESDFMTLEY